MELWEPRGYETEAVVAPLAINWERVEGDVTVDVTSREHGRRGLGRGVGRITA